MGVLCGCHGEFGLSQLLHPDDEKRLKTLTGMKAHPFFESLEWEKVEAKEVTPLYVPPVSWSLDLMGANSPPPPLLVVFYKSPCHIHFPGFVAGRMYILTPAAGRD